MKFKVWLESSNTAQYNKYWKPVFEKLKSQRQDRFKDWFPKQQDRIYIPVNIPASEISQDAVRSSETAKKEVSELLSKFGYKIINWGKGLVSDSKGNILPLEKVLSQTGNEEAKQAYSSWIGSNYSGVRLNPKQNKFLVIISKNLHDIARMSTARPWGSCISLPLKFFDKDKEVKVQSYVKTDIEDEDNPGKLKFDFKKVPLEEDSTYKKLKEEILEGGLVAYLTTEDDKDLERPIARIHMPRYEDEVSGKSFVLCKDDSSLVYGKRQLDFFIKIVKNWLDQQQKEAEDRLTGFYTRKASRWAEGTPHDIFGLQNLDEDYLRKAIDHYLEQDDRYTASKYIYAILSKLSNNWTISDDFWQYLKDIIFNNKALDTSYTLLNNIFKKYPNKIKYEDILKLNEPSVFFGRSLFGGFGEGYKEFQDWSMDQFDKLTKEPIDKNKVDLILRIVNQNKYALMRDANRVKAFALWADKLIETKDKSLIKDYMVMMLNFYNYSELIYKHLNKALEKYGYLVAEDEKWTIKFYLDDLKQNNLPLPVGFES